MEQNLKYASPTMSIDDNVEYWHNHETGNELHEFLCLPEDQYDLWLKCELSDEDVEKYIKDKNTDIASL